MIDDFGRTERLLDLFEAVGHLLSIIVIVYVATAGHIQIERPLKTLEEKKEKEKHNKSSVSPTEIQAVFMTLKPAK